MTTSHHPEEKPDGYSLSRLLGRTRLAETYLGEESASGTPIVFKLLTVPLSERDRFHVLETMRTYARILHPGLVRILEVGLRGNSPFMVTEYAAAGSLRQRYPPGTRLRPEIVLPIVSQLGAALQHLHRQGALHLDLKPENILFKQDGGVMLSDAGLLSVPVLMLDRLADEHESTAYLAPELMMGLPVAASDQYALACLLYEWLSGQPPFVGSPREVRARHLHVPPPPLKAPVPAALDLVLRRALEKDPGRRFPTIAAFCDASIQAMREMTSQPGFSSAFSASLSSRPSPSPALSEQVHLQQEEGASEEREEPSLPTCRLCHRPTPIGGAPLICPTCSYPLDLREEERFLELLIAELNRLAQAGAASLPVGELVTLSIPSLLALRREVHFAGAASWPLGQAVDRYWRRLLEVRHLLATQGMRSVSSAGPARVQQGQSRPVVSEAAEPAPRKGAQKAESAALDDTLIRKALTPRRQPEQEQVAQAEPSPLAQPDLPSASPAAASAPPQQRPQPPLPAVAQSGALAAPGQPQQQETAAAGAAAPGSALPAAAASIAPVEPAANVTNPPAPALRSPLTSAPRPAPSAAAPPRPPIPPRPPRPPRPSPITTLRPLVESPVALMVALGTFLLLAALLVFHIANLQHALPVTIGAQLFFAAMVVITGRSRHFREFRGIYALFFALTVPLLFPDLRVLSDFFAQYQPWLLALTALYGAVTYGILAVSQRFSPFAILCAVALAVADVSLVRALAGDQWGWWVPAGMLLLALVEAEALGSQTAASRSPLGRLLHTSWDVLRRPLAFSSWALASVVTGFAGLLSFILLLALLVAQPPAQDLTWLGQLQPALLAALLLASVWLLRLGTRTHHRAVAYPLCALLTLIPSLASALIAPERARLACSFSLLLVTACFDGYARLAPPALWLYLRPERWLTALRFLLLLLVPFLAVLPSQVQVTGQLQGDLLVGSLIVLASAALLLLMTLWPAPEAAAQGDQRLILRVSPWLLLLPGSLLVWGYAALGQALSWPAVGPLWWFGACCGGLLGLSWLIRQRTSQLQAAPWEVLALAVAMLISLPLSFEYWSDLSSALVLLLLALLGYSMLLAQRRSLWLPLPGLLLLTGLGLLGLWIASNYQDRWSVLLLACSLLLPPLAAGLRRFFPAGTALYPRLTDQGWEAERLFTVWEWDGPVMVLALGAALWLLGLLLSSHSQDWARSALAGAADWPWLAGLARSAWLAIAEALAAGLAAYLAGLWSKDRLWLAPAALCALVALWLARGQFWPLVATVVGTAAIGMAMSHLRGQRWAIPWYVAALFSLLLVMWQALLPSPEVDSTYDSTYVLLGLTGVVTVVSLVEDQPAALWLVPFLLLEASSVALLYRQGWLPDVLLVPALVPLGALGGVGLSFWGRRQRGAAGQQQRWRWAAPWYAGALVGLGLTSLVILAGPWPAQPLQILWLEGPYLLLAFTAIATGVGLLERVPAMLWLVPLLVVEVCVRVLSALLSGYQRPPAEEGILPVVLVPACALLGLALDRLGGPPRQQRLRYAAPWYAAALLSLGAVSVTLFSNEPSLPWHRNPLLPLAYAVLVTAVGWLEELPETLWLVPLLLLEASVAALLPEPGAQASLLTALLVPALVPLGALGGVGLGFWCRRRPGAADQGQRWRWVAPWYAGALVGVAATSMALFGKLWDTLPLQEAGPYLLLGFAAIAGGIGLLERRPEALWLLPALVVEVCSLLLRDLLAPGTRLSQLWGEPELLLSLTPACVLIGLGFSRLSNLPRQQRLYYAGPGYTAALIALGAACLALFFAAPRLPWLQPLRPSLLLGYAALGAPVALAEGLPEVLWLIPLLTGLAIAAIAGSDQEQAPLLPGIVLLTTLIALAGSRLARRHLAWLSTSKEPQWHLRLVAPWYATAALAACATPFVWPTFLGVAIVALLLLLYAFLSFWVAFQERWPLVTLTTVLFGLWGLLWLTQHEELRPLLLPLGMGALAVAFLADVLLRPAASYWPAGLETVIRPSWALAWVPLVVLTWVSFGLLHPSPLSALPAADSWGATLAALLIYGSGILLRQVGVCWLSLPPALFTLLRLGWPDNPAGPDMGGLALFCLLCTVGLVGGAALGRRWPLLVRPYLFPLLSANCAGVLAVGLAGTGLGFPPSQHESALPAAALLLGYGLFLWLLALYLNRPLLTLLTGLWTVWGMALLALALSSDRDAVLISIGAVAALLGLLGLHRSHLASVSTRRHQASVIHPTRHEEEAL